MSLNALMRWLRPHEMVFFDLLEESAGNAYQAAQLFDREVRANDPERWPGLLSPGVEGADRADARAALGRHRGAVRARRQVHVVTRHSLAAPISRQGGAGVRAGRPASRDGASPTGRDSANMRE